MTTTTTADTAPDAATDEPAAELIALARRVEAWREGRGLSQRQLCRQIGGLNSKTHASLVAGNLTELRPENHVPKYRAALLEIEAFDKRQEAEPIIAGLTPTQQIATAIAGLVLNRGNDRFVLIEGESGAGKSTGLRHVHSIYPGSVLVSAHEGWTSPCFALAEILKGIGYRGKEGWEAAGFSKLLAILKTRCQDKPRLILIDEGHHMEHRLLNVIKELINSTGCWVAVATMTSLWRKIQSQKWSEVKQLIHNRMHVRQCLTIPTSGEVETFFIARLSLNVPESGPEANRWDRAFDGVADSARNHGLWAYCRKVAATSRLIAMQRGEPLTPDDILTAAAAIIGNTEGFDR